MKWTLGNCAAATRDKKTDSDYSSSSSCSEKVDDVLGLVTYSLDQQHHRYRRRMVDSSSRMSRSRATISQQRADHHWHASTSSSSSPSEEASSSSSSSSSNSMEEEEETADESPQNHHQRRRGNIPRKNAITKRTRQRGRNRSSSSDSSNGGGGMYDEVRPLAISENNVRGTSTKTRPTYLENDEGRNWLHNSYTSSPVVPIASSSTSSSCCWSSSTSSSKSFRSFLHNLDWRLLFLVFSLVFSVSDACSTRPSPKPRPPRPNWTPDLGPNVLKENCTDDYAELYCMNAGRCYRQKILETFIVNCECQPGFVGARCQYRDVPDKYLPVQQRIETASIAGGVCVLLIIVTLASLMAWFYYKRRRSVSNNNHAALHAHGRV